MENEEKKSQINNSPNSFIIDSNGSTVDFSNSSFVLGGENNNVTGAVNSGIYGGKNNNIGTNPQKIVQDFINELQNDLNIQALEKENISNALNQSIEDSSLLTEAMKATIKSIPEIIKVTPSLVKLYGLIESSGILNSIP